MKLLLYCTKAKPFLINDCSKFYLDNKGYNYYWKKGMVALEHLNGKVVAECDFKVEEIVCVLRNTKKDGFFEEYTTKSLSEKELLYASKIDEISFINYLNSKNGYAIHIKNLHIFDESRELNYYYQLDKKALKENEYEVKAITKAPQNMMYCEDGLETKIIISIRPEWLCKILNGEKTIEVRKKVLKEMLNDKQRSVRELV